MTMHRGNILVVDDESDLVAMIKMILHAKGYEIATASNGEDGLEKLKKFSPNLIILDMNMPKMGGIAFYHRICSIAGKDAQPKYPVLVMTARANLEELFNGLKVEGFIAKPFEIEAFLKTVDAIMDRYRTAA
ncbi:MAG: response regulator transcription factor [Candidatus Omnitrophica bacterium]|nr:response regulator transcription factor [Candidatus Omnitrophota bacterium]